MVDFRNVLDFCGLREVLIRVINSCGTIEEKELRILNLFLIEGFLNLMGWDLFPQAVVHYTPTLVFDHACLVFWLEGVIDGFARGFGHWFHFELLWTKEDQTLVKILSLIFGGKLNKGYISGGPDSFAELLFQFI